MYISKPSVKIEAADKVNILHSATASGKFEQ